MLLVPKQSWGYTYSSTSATRIGLTWGTAITASATTNTMGNWSQVVAPANVPTDIYGIHIRITSNASTTAAANGLLDIGVDPAGGTNYTTVIPFLSCSHPPPAASFGVIDYYFPLYIKSGSSIAARQQNTTASNQCSVGIKLFGKPSRPDIIQAGHKVTAYGHNATTSLGTAVTPGTNNEGAWTALGGTTSSLHWWWQMGLTVDDTTMSILSYNADLSVGDATTKEIVIEEMIFQTNTAEQQIHTGSITTIGSSFVTPIGSNVYGRLQCSGTTADAGLGLIAYGLT